MKRFGCSIACTLLVLGFFAWLTAANPTQENMNGFLLAILVLVILVVIPMFVPRMLHALALRSSMIGSLGLLVAALGVYMVFFGAGGGISPEGFVPLFLGVAWACLWFWDAIRYLSIDADFQTAKRSRRPALSESDFEAIADRFFATLPPFTGDRASLGDSERLPNSTVYSKEYDLVTYWGAGQAAWPDHPQAGSLKLSIGLDRDGKVTGYTYHLPMLGISNYLSLN